MDIDVLPQNKISHVTIKMIDPQFAKEICHSMKAALPKWLRIPETYPEYKQDIENQMFAACIDNEYVGMINIQLPAASNAHIDVMVVSQPVHLESIGAKLLSAAENYCYECGYSSLTIETLSPRQTEVNNLRIYHLYEKSGYKPLLENYSTDSHSLMVYMQKFISLNDFTFVDLTHSLSPDVPHWGTDAGFKYNARYIQTSELPEDAKFRVQRLEMSAGIGTHMDAPSHCFEHASAIADIPLPSLITVCRVIDVSSKAHDRYSLAVEDVQHFEEEYGIIPKDAFVIIYTGWDQRWAQPEKYRNDKIFPNISIEAAKMLLSRDIVGLGIDTLSPDAFGSDFPVHRLILGSGKYIIENIANAKQLHPTGCYIFALPIKITDGTEAPIRLIGMKRK